MGPSFLVFSTTSMERIFRERLRWPVLFLVAGIPRVLGAFFLPNAFGDAYVYIRDIGTLSTKISNGTFQLTDLFGFWLPLYQFISAVLNVFVKNGFYSGKIVTALFGAATCLLVYTVTWRLTQSRRAAFWMFLIIALNPLHIFYSASAMTDVPHGFFVLAALYFVLTGNWIVAATFGALAGLTRVESWMLIAIIPFLALIRERRVSLIAILILLVPPLFWCFVSWKATGDAFACFKQRQEYHDWLLTMNPAIAHFSFGNLLRDGATLLVSADIAVLLACLFAGWIVLRDFWKRRNTRLMLEVQLPLPAVTFVFAFLGLLLVAYLTHQQPIIFPRYGLILFTLGLPLLAWTYLHVRQQKPQLARRVLTAVIIILCFDASVQLVGAIGEINRYKAQRAVADYLRDHFDPNSDVRILCDEGTVRVLSGIPEERFVSSANVHGTRQEIWKMLRDKDVAYLVIAANGEGVLTDLEIENDSTKPVLMSDALFLPTHIGVYQISSRH